MKKILLLCLSIILVMSVFPLSVFAGGITATPEELDYEISNLVGIDYFELVKFRIDGKGLYSEFWINLKSGGFFQNYQSYGPSNGTVNNYVNDAHYVTKNSFDLSDGFIFQICTNFSYGDMTQFDGDVNAIQIGSVKLVIDCGQNIDGTRGSGLYLYNDDVLIASADTGAEAGDATFISNYMAEKTYYYIRLVKGMLSVSTSNANADIDIAWTLTDGSVSSEVAVQPVGMDEAKVQLVRAGNIGCSSSDSGMTFFDPKLGSAFPFITVFDFVNYIRSFTLDNTDEEFALARTLINDIKNNATTALECAAVTPYENTFKYYEAAKNGLDGEIDTSGRDSGNVPSSFFTVEKWTTVEDALVYKMGDGSIKFDRQMCASFDSYYNSGLKFQIRSVYNWKISFRNSTAKSNDGYVIGYDGGNYFYFKKGESGEMLARGRVKDSAIDYDNAEWHEFEIQFKDNASTTEIRVYIDGLLVNFIPVPGDTRSSSTTEALEAYALDISTIAINDGYIVDYVPKQYGNFIKINQYTNDWVNGNSTISLRSVDCTEKSSIKTITCVGDSITQGSCATSDRYSYPAYLQRILGTDNYSVFNCGRAAAHLQNGGWAPYRIQKAWYMSLASKADYVIVMLGTNDAQNALWESDTDPEKKQAKFDSFAEQYRAVLQTYIDLGCEVIVMTSPQAYFHTDPYYPYVSEVVAVQKLVAEEMGLDVIDLFAYSETIGEDYTFYSDGLHFGDAGYERVAQFVADYIKTLDLDEGKEIVVPDLSEQYKAENSTPVTGLSSGTVFTQDDIRNFSVGINGTDSFRGVIGGGGAQMWVFLNDTYNLGNSFEWSFSIMNGNTQCANTVYSEDLDPFDYSTWQFSSFKLGALEIRLVNIKNDSGKVSAIVDFYINGQYVDRGFIDGGADGFGTNTIVNFKVKFNNGSIEILGGISKYDTLITITPEEYFAIRGTVGYTFDGVKFNFGSTQTGWWISFKNLSIVKK